jgi:HEAT repeats
MNHRPTSQNNADRTNRHPDLGWVKQHWGTIVITVGLLLLVSGGVYYAAGSSDPTAAIAHNLGIVGAVVNRQNQNVGASNATINFQRQVNTLASEGTVASLNTLLLTLRQSEPIAHRDLALTALDQVPNSFEPQLSAALQDVDPGIRAGVAHALGTRHDYHAISALMDATHDSSPQVRSEAARSLGEIDAWQALPQLEQLQVIDGDYNVQQAARSAKTEVQAQLAHQLGLAPSNVLDIEISTNPDNPRLFAATATDLYEWRGSGWRYAGRLPDIPTTFAVGPQAESIYLATKSSGLYRSLDSGATWQHVQFGQQTPTQLSVTALTIDPHNTHRLYIALTARGADDKQNPVGIFSSSDDGADWTLLPDSPTAAVTAQLVIDPQQPAFLFGIADGTPWRYTLPAAACESCQN